MEVEILSTSLIEEYEIIDYYTQYIELELSGYISVSEFCQITDYAVVRVDYLEDGYATYNDEVKCVKIDGKWFVLSHGFI